MRTRPALRCMLSHPLVQWLGLCLPCKCADVGLVNPEAMCSEAGTKVVTESRGQSMSVEA